MTRRKKSAIALMLITFCLGCGVWTWFLSGRPLEEADSWSSILSGFAGLAFGVSGLVFGLLAIRDSPPTTPEPHGRPATSKPDSATGSIRIDGDVHGPVIYGDNNTVEK
ncbi:hypothetical protein [Streptosporangium sp. NPDC001681]|uniref:hypothetical protein n=1 Tax=Streptosporangium sp. NPDC001681 TaxID=3154395 RepID=UPI003324A75C